MTSDCRTDIQRPLPPCGVTEAVEFLCISVILIETVCLSYAFGGSWVSTNSWLLGRYVVFVIYLVDFFVSLGLGCHEFHRIRRYLRPYFLISSSQLMKKLLNCLRRTLPKIFSTLFLLVLWLISASLVALCLFSSPAKNPKITSNVITSVSFPDFYTSMFNLLVMITTANHPDVILDVYNKNRASAIFSFVFLGVGLYVLMNILTAVVYSEFRGYLLTYISSFGDSDLNGVQFMQLFRKLDSSSRPFEESGLRPVRPGFARVLQQWIVSSAFVNLCIAVSMLNIAHLVVDISDRITSSAPVSLEIRIINFCFVAFYIFEEGSLMWALGPNVYCSQFIAVFRMTTVGLLLIAKLVELGFLINGIHFTLWDFVRLSNILLLTRAVRVVHLFTWTQLVAGVLLDLPRNLAPVLGILSSAYYIYALLGMSLFHGVITYPLNHSQFQCGTYQQLEYWSINFDDFAASIVLLWDLMVVNNWFVIVNAFQEAVNTWVHVYMISWWVLAVVCLLSLVTALIIETFVHRRDLYTQALQQAQQPRELAIIHAPCALAPVNRLPTTEIDRNFATHSDPVSQSSPTDPVTDSEQIASPSPSSDWILQSDGLPWGQPVTAINASSLDEIFRSGLNEPTDDELFRLVTQHKHIQHLQQKAQLHRTATTM